MSLAIVAIAGIVVGFMCLIVGFLMDDAKPMPAARAKKKAVKKKVVAVHKKAA